MLRATRRLSLRARLLFAVVAAVAIALTTTALATRVELRRYLFSRVDQALAGTIEPIAHEHADDHGDSRNDQRLRIPDDTYLAFVNADGTLTPSDSGTGPPDPPGRADVARFARSARERRFGTVPSSRSGAAPFRVLAAPLTDGRTAVVAVSLVDQITTLDRLDTIALGVAAAALLIAAMAGVFLVRAGLRPLRDFEKTAAAVATGELEHRVPGAGQRTEFGRLATTFNTMVERIEQAFTARDHKEEQLRHSEERMRRFVADASHELRTPVAAAAAYTELNRSERTGDRTTSNAL